MLAAHLFDNTLAYHMVRQAAEGLYAYDVGSAVLDQFKHLRGQEPSLAGLVAQGYDVLSHFSQFPDMTGRLEALRRSQRFISGLAHIFDVGDDPVADTCGPLVRVVVLRLEVRIVEAVQEEVSHLRLNRLSAFPFQKLYQVIVGSRKVLDQDLSDDTDSRLLLIRDGKIVEFRHDLPAQRTETSHGDTS